MMKKSDARRAERFARPGCMIRLCWLDQDGMTRMALAPAINLSESGMAVELPEPVLTGTKVRLHADRERLWGRASVRHCRPQSGRYMVGLQFEEGMRWEAPVQSRPEPVHAGVMVDAGPTWDWGFR
ncbi:MAG: PilZ domain-containing protein [Bryobacterales bacterium]|nr:PilZ domain-containing protein [Bryobacterales bacterium]